MRKVSRFKSLISKAFSRSLRRLNVEPSVEATANFCPDTEVSPIRPTLAPVVPINRRHPILAPKPSLSVVIGSFNRRPLLELAIESVRRETAGIEAEIIVVDGGSTDGSIPWLVTQSDVISVVQHNRSQENGAPRRRKSWGEFMNMGFRAAAGDLILMISDDCLLLDGAVRNSLDRWRSAEAAGLNVGACAYYFRDWPRDNAYYVQRTLGGNLMVNHGLYARTALDAVGWADGDRYVFYKADTDLSLKIWAAGYAIIDCAGSICEHYVGFGDEIRASNTALLDDDRAALLERWPDLATRASGEKMGKIISSVQPFGLAELLWGKCLDADRASADEHLRMAP